MRRTQDASTSEWQRPGTAGGKLRCFRLVLPFAPGFFRQPRWSHGAAAGLVGKSPLAAAGAALVLRSRAELDAASTLRSAPVSKRIRRGVREHPGDPGPEDLFDGNHGDLAHGGEGQPRFGQPRCAPRSRRWA
jgi:hypothetical protein